jgi:flagellar motor switch protein FliN/FliY
MADDPPTSTATEAADATVAVAPDEASSPFANLEPQPEGEVAPIANGALDDAGALELVFDVPVRLSVELGRTDIPIRDVVNLGRGSIIELDRGPGMPLDVRVNGVLIGRGEVVLVNDEKLGLRFVEVVSPAERVKRLS